MHRPNLKSVALPVPEIIALKFRMGVANRQSWGRGGRTVVGVGIVLFERGLVSSYKLSIVTFPCFKDIAAFVLQHATFSHRSSIVSPKFPHVPLGVGGWPLGYEERRCVANFPCN